MKDQQTSPAVGKSIRKEFDPMSLKRLESSLSWVDRHCRIVDFIYEALSDLADDAEGDDLREEGGKDFKALVYLLGEQRECLDESVRKISEQLADLGS